MLRPKNLPVILVVVSAATVLTARVSLSEPQAQDCRAAPGASTPRGGHWHYRINHADKQRCWYLSPADAHSNGRATASLTSTPVPARQRRNASEAIPAAPSQAAATESAAGDTVSASAQAPPAEVAFVRPSSGVPEGQIVFGARWPEKLPDAQDVRAQDPERSEPPPPSDSYAENHAGTDVTQTPLRWPVVETSRAGLISNVETVLRSFSIAGGLLMAALLLAGWAARFIRGSRRWDSPDRRHPVAAEVDPTQQVNSAEIAEGADGIEDAGVPTDPACDLKISLAELMRDLHRAEAASESARLSEGRDSRHQDTQYQVLQAAE
jgi:hypothetical protein